MTGADGRAGGPADGRSGGRAVGWFGYWVGVLFAVDALVVGVMEIRLSHNNFRIFATAYHHLAAGANMYAADPAGRLDFYRYSPTFALLFAPFAVAPEALGLIGWSLLNALTLYAAVRLLLPARQANVALLVAALDLNSSLQNMQSNALVAGLMILAFVAYERERTWRGAWAVGAGAAVKIFPAGAALFGLLHAPRGGRPLARVLLALAGVAVVLVLLPLPLTGWSGLVRQYRWWAANEQQDIQKTAYSVMALIGAWIGTLRAWWPVQLAGLAGLLVPVALRRDAWTDAGFRRVVLASVLCFVVLFNHRAESPSFVIAMAGVGIWWAAGPRKRYQNVLLLLCLALVALPHDFVPHVWNSAVLNPARLRVVPVLASWIAMQVELLRWDRAAAGAGAEALPATA